VFILLKVKYFCHLELFVLHLTKFNIFNYEIKVSIS